MSAFSSASEKKDSEIINQSQSEIVTKQIEIQISRASQSPKKTFLPSPDDQESHIEDGLADEIQNRNISENVIDGKNKNLF
jgi:hypothetical protein